MAIQHPYRGHGSFDRRVLLLSVMVVALGLASTDGFAQRLDGLDAGGFALSSADGAWRLRLRGLVHIDGRIFADDSTPDDDDEWVVRRVRPSFEGTSGDRVSFRIMPDFGGGKTEITDVWIDTRLRKRFTVRAGKFKPPVGLERLQSAGDLRIIERSWVTDLVPKRDVGVQLASDGRRVDWQAGIFNGVTDRGTGDDQDDDGNQELAARVFAEPWKDGAAGGLIGFGIGATHGRRDGTPLKPLLADHRSPGQNTVFGYRVGPDGTFAAGNRTRLVPELYWYRGSFGLLAEGAREDQDVSRTGAGFDRSASLELEAWQVTAEWFATGEAAGYRDPPGMTGAVQLVARVSGLAIDGKAFADAEASFADPAIAVRRARTLALGANWFPVAGVKASIAYHHTAFAGGAPSGDRPDEDVLLMRLQYQF